MKGVKVTDIKHVTGFFRNHDSLFTVICLVSFTLLFTVIPCVYASDEDAVNVLEFPDRLSVMMGIPLFAARVLATALVTGLLTFVPILAKNIVGTIFMGILSLCVCIGLQWIEPFMLIIIILMIVALLGAKMRDWIGGTGGGGD